MLLFLPPGLLTLAGRPIDLSGRWVGAYGPHGDEVVDVRQSGAEVVAVKVTGDANVPAGQTTWRATLRGWFGPGEGQVAETGFRDPKFVPGLLRLVAPDLIVFEWEGLGAVVFRRLGQPEEGRKPDLPQAPTRSLT